MTPAVLPPARRAARLASLLSAAALLAAGCGGGGGGSPFSLEPSAAALEFAADRGAAVPAAQDLTIAFKGDGLALIDAPDTALPSWLQVTAEPQVSSPATVTVRVLTTNLAAGLHTATLRFVTGKLDGSDYIQRDVPVRYRVSNGLSAGPGSLAFTAREGEVPAARTLTLGSDRLPMGWTLTVAPATADWLVPAATAGTLTESAGTVEVSVTARPMGTYRATLLLVDDRGRQRLSIPVTYEVLEPLGLEAAPASLAFTAFDATSPQPQFVTLTSGAYPMDWSLDLEPVAGGPIGWVLAPVASGRLEQGSTQVEIGAAPRAPGSYAATLVVRDGRGAERARIPLTYVVAPAYSVPPVVTRTLTHASRWSDLDVPFTIQPLVDPVAGAAARWEVVPTFPWVTVSPASGDLSAPTRVVASLDPAFFWASPNGAYDAGLTVRFTAGGLISTNVHLAVQAAISPAYAVTSPAAMAVTGSTTAGELSRTLAVSHDLGEVFASHAGWHASTSAAWLTATPAGAGALSLGVAPAGLAPLANGSHQATVTVTPDDARLAAASATASLTLALPEVSLVAPSTAWVDRGGEVVVRGKAFSGAPILPVTFGASAPVDGRVVSDTELRATVPPQAEAGRVRVTVENGLGIDRAAGELVVLPAPGYLAHQVSSTKLYQRITLDPERQAVLLTGYGTGEVRRLRFAGGAWTSDAFVASNATGVGVLQDGSSLLVTAGTVNTSHLFLRLDPDTLALRESTGASPYYEQVDFVAPFNDGRTLLLDSNQWVATHWYPSLAQGAYVNAHSPYFLLTRDRSRLVINGRTSGGWSSLDAGADRSVARSVAAGVTYASELSVSGDGGRLLIRTAVHDRDFALLGNVSLEEQTTLGMGVAVAPDGRTAYLLGRDATTSAWVFRRADVSAAAGPYPVDAAPLPFSIAAGEFPVFMTVSEDGSCLFLLTRSPLGPGGVTTGTIFRALPLP